MANDKDSAVTQADIDAAKLYLQGTGPWKLDEIGIGPDDSLVQAFARHRQHAYDHGYYDGRIRQPTQSDALREALEGWRTIYQLAPPHPDIAPDIWQDMIDRTATALAALQEQNK